MYINKTTLINSNTFLNKFISFYTISLKMKIYMARFKQLFGQNLEELIFYDNVVKKSWGKNLRQLFDKQYILDSI